MSHRTPAARCLGCGTILNAASAVDGADIAPQPGFLSVCLYCGRVGEFTAELVLRPLSEDEMAALPSEVLQALARCQETVAALERLRRRVARTL